MNSPTPADEKATMAPNATGPDRIDIQSDAALAEWGRRLDVTPDQLKDAVAAVGDAASDVELHLKGTRSSVSELATKKAGA